MIKSKSIFILSFVLSLLVSNISKVNAQVCATPTKDGDNNSLNGTVNSYWTPANGTYNGASSAISISTRRGASVNIQSGDLVLIIQIQCANINSTDSDAYGDGVSGDNDIYGSLIATGYSDPAGSCLAGRYEYLRAGPLTSSSSLDLSQNPLTNTYVQAAITNTTGLRRFQVIRVPQYNSATLSGSVTAPVWNGLTGGVVALDVANQLDFASFSVNVDGLGFRGGGGRARSANNAVLRYRSIADTRHAVKGEGIVSTPRYVSTNRSPTSSATTTIVDLVGTGMGYPSGTASPADFARGAPGNAGGGGTFWDGASDNGGGGAGGNGGAGGRGGAGWRSAGYSGINANYSNLSDKKWGFGGTAFTSSVSRLVFGGGGAAGDNNNNSTAVESSGAAGGGIVLIRAREILGTGNIFARGARASNNSLNDGAGAGGAGGSVIVVSSDMSSSTLTINAAGGRGGDTWLTGGSAHGTGGGGGGGVVYRTGAATVVVTGGTNGLTNTSDSPPDGASHGAKPGDPGINTLITVPTDTPGINTGFRCMDFGDAPSSYGLANHNLNIIPNNLRIGAILPDGDRSILSAIPSINANADDLNNASDDEDGVTLPSVSTLSGVYTATVIVRNNSGVNANLCGWMDFDQDGLFQADESICQIVTSMGANQSISMAFTVPVIDRTNTGQIFGRFRLTTNALTTSNPTGLVDNGEVEDHSVTVTTLPVSVYKFNSKLIGDNLNIVWATASETSNAGFNIWGVNKSGSIKLNTQLIPSKSTGVLKSTEYFHTLNANGLEIDELALSAMDVRGNEEIFGYYKIGKSFGRSHMIKNTDWNSINDKINTTLLRNKSYKNQNTDNNKSAQELKLLIKPNKSGMQKITYEDLIANGLDLTGVNNNDIAVTINASPVPRFVGENNQYIDLIFKNSYDIDTSDLFGPNSSIDFWAKPADFPDAEYLDFYTYEISIAPELVKKHQYKPIRGNIADTTYLHTKTDDKNNAYDFTVPSDDPWYAKRLINFSNDGAKQYSANFEIDSALINQVGSRINVSVSGGTNMPENPDHEVGIFINDQLINTTQFEGVSEKLISVDMPQNLLQIGNNVVTLKLTDGTQAQYDIVTVDQISLSYKRELNPIDGILEIEQLNNNNSLLVNNISNQLESAASFYSYDGNSLSILESEYSNQNTIKIANNNSQTASYWISNSVKINKPEIGELIAVQDLITDNKDYIIIAHPAFIPLNEDSNHAMNQYINARSAEGWNIKLVSILDIQNQFNGGMNLPNAVTKFLSEYQKTSSIKHVLLVGNDSYDYKNQLGINSTSFIPTMYTPTLYVPHTPSDALLTDINGDGISNISIGRWPVRSMSELDNIVNKTLNWSTSTDLNAVYITDIEDDEIQSFELQANRMIETINDSAANIEVVEIFPNNIPYNNGVNSVDLSRELLFSAWENKHSLSNFIGHGSPTQWSRQGILASGDLNNLNNQNFPTLIGTLTCYSSYFVSPVTDSLSLTLMNGANEIPNGAVAIHGAATLSSYSGNEVFANHVLEQQLQGKTLGSAILSARNLAHSLGYNDQATNWILLGDPTLVLNLESEE